jgi:GNAT superfamily N-acetyltransferase
MYTIHPLSARPQHVEACAAWAYGRWGVQRAEGSFGRALALFRAAAEGPGPLPLTLIAEDGRGLPVGMGSLWAQDGDAWPQHTPWAAALYTHYRWRGRGVARAILARLEDAARAQGHTALYLHTGSAVGLYAPLGYAPLETIPADTGAGTLTLMRKAL